MNVFFAAIFERLRNVLHEGDIDTRVQYMVEVMFAVRKDGFKVRSEGGGGVIARKPDFFACKQQRRRQACADAQHLGTFVIL